MEITSERNHPIQQSESNRQIFQWASDELEKKGYSRKISARIIKKMMIRMKDQKASFIQWVTDRPVYTESHYHKQHKARLFIQHQVSRMIVRSLMKKGYPKQSACHLAYTLIRHAGGPEHCDITAVLEATKSWPKLKRP
ncbi:hypothetical protein [Endozoicomonas numazuensis]|uniref:Uncharacterized protein n=1 Tax=Endozoicomonas numazuensis TaxID=1137799 RepID=A0A081NDT5_9GAMM|nr:hypothetical protein [Endozoicomonas numazuensis]KEQ16608.1 hypothetical protein GZ78_22535 [Endozoicomonas numazuensis]